VAKKFSARVCPGIAGADLCAEVGGAADINFSGCSVVVTGTSESFDITARTVMSRPSTIGIVVDVDPEMTD